ncbi:MAG: hypothetical protein ABEJ36_03110 [Candidatus Nanosalina sp.]
MKEKLTKGVGLVSGFSLSSIALIRGYYFLLAGEYVSAYLGAFLGWVGYLVAHYTVTGTLIDDRLGEKDLGNGERIWVLGVGSALFIGGISSVIAFLNAQNVVASYLGLMAVFAGYTVIHYESTGRLL